MPEYSRIPDFEKSIRALAIAFGKLSARTVARNAEELVVQLGALNARITRLEHIQTHILKSTEPTSEMLDSSVETLDLSTRAQNCLENAGIKTIRDLTSIRLSDLFKNRSFGRKTFREINQELFKHGLWVGKDAGYSPPNI